MSGDATVVTRACFSGLRAVGCKVVRFSAFLAAI